MATVPIRLLEHLHFKEVEEGAEVAMAEVDVAVEAVAVNQTHQPTILNNQPTLLSLLKTFQDINVL